MTSPYNANFFSGQASGSRRSAAKIVPILIDLVRPSSVVDVGCGIGIWLAEFASRGTPMIRGMDGDWVPRDQLQIPADRFTPADLAAPPPISERFDLATCLEVGEHLPESAARPLVRSLTTLAPVVAFSGAIPLQGGRDHINCQWQSWWAALFAEHGYKPIDAVRPHVWRDPDVEFWYAQNILVYASPDALASSSRLSAELARTAPCQPDLVHPSMYLWAANKDRGVSSLLKALPAAAARSIRRRFRPRR
jgi:SAM-dependent methyltransferase